MPLLGAWIVPSGLAKFPPRQPTAATTTGSVTSVVPPGFCTTTSVTTLARVHSGIAWTSVMPVHG